MNDGSTRKDYFRTRGYVPGGLVSNAAGEAVAVGDLPPFLRVLLATDGTVTKSLEAYFWEPVLVENLGQAPGPLPADMPMIDARQGEPVLERRVRLKGAESGNAYAYAESVVRVSLLPDDVRDSLVAGRIGIGELLRECGLETYREILDVGGTQRRDIADILGRDDGLVYRTYRISLARRPTILITEYFPLGLFAAGRR